MTHKILSISLNPALDAAADVPVVKPEIKLRCTNASLEPGGGGVNVARAIKLLGGDSRVFVALAGATGNMLADMLVTEGVRLQRFEGPGLTNQSYAVRETSTGKQYRFSQIGQSWSEALAANALEDITKLIKPKMLVVVSGSLPVGVDDGFYCEIGQRVMAAEAQLIVDTSGRAQKALLAGALGQMYVLRMDRHESEVLAGKTLKTLEDAAGFAQSLAKQGMATLVVMARGAEGSVFATATERFHCVSPKKPVLSKVGAGDSFVAGLTLGLARGLSFQEAGKLATAAASAAVMTAGSQLCPLALVETQLAGTKLTAL